jgi:tetratricopeptide (TPR) repeat protein
MGKIYLEMGRYPDALAEFEQALTLQPHDVESWYSRASALACLGRHAAALHSLEQAQELAGFANAHLWVQKAVLLILLDDPTSALNCCNQALWRSPNHAQAWLFRGVSLHRLGRFRAACRSYQRVAQTAPPTPADSLRRLCHDLAPNQQAG